MREEKKRRIGYVRVHTKQGPAGSEANKAIKYEYRYSIKGLIVAGIVILLGAVLIGMGIEGKVALEIGNIKLNSSFPGFGLVIVGMIIARVTKFRVEIV